MIVKLSIVLLLWLMCLISFKIKLRTIMHPAILVISFWLASLCLAISDFSGVFPPSFESLFINLALIFGFFIGTFIWSKKCKKLHSIEVNSIHSNQLFFKKYDKFYYFICGFVILFYGYHLRYALPLIISGEEGNFRDAIFMDKENSPIFKNSFTQLINFRIVASFLFLITPYALISYFVGKKKFALLLGLLAFLLQSLVMLARTQIVNFMWAIFLGFIIYLARQGLGHGLQNRIREIFKTKIFRYIVLIFCVAISVTAIRAREMTFNQKINKFVSSLVSYHVFNFALLDTQLEDYGSSLYAYPSYGTGLFGGIVKPAVSVLRRVDTSLEELNRYSLGSEERYDFVVCGETSWGAPIRANAHYSQAYVLFRDGGYLFVFLVSVLWAVFATKFFNSWLIKGCCVDFGFSIFLYQMMLVGMYSGKTPSEGFWFAIFFFVYWKFNHRYRVMS